MEYFEGYLFEINIHLYVLIEQKRANNALHLKATRQGTGTIEIRKKGSYINKGCTKSITSKDPVD